LPCDPLEIICEILGQPAAQMNTPVNADYQCPFINSICIKRSQRIGGPFPVCTVFKSHKDSDKAEPVIVCPKRFYEADLFKDVIKYAWTNYNPANPKFVHEIRMGEVGNVDFVVVDAITTESGIKIKNFISAELQAVDITGTYEPAYSAIVLSQPLDSKPTYNFNYANVRKRFITQLISKGFFHHHWDTKIVAIVQDHIYDNIKQKIKFSDSTIEESHILFMQYKLVESNGEYHLQFKDITGTTHSNLMMGSLYAQVPPKEDFCKGIIKQLSRN